MSSSVAPTTTSIAPVQRYVLHAYTALTSSVATLRAIREALPEAQCERYSPECVVCHIGRTQKLFVFKFGAVVFFNIPIEEHPLFLTRLDVVAHPHNPNPDDEDPGVAKDDFVVTIASGVSQVAFGGVTIPDWDLTKVQLIAQLLAQSGALEIIEREVEEFIARSEGLASMLQKSGWVKTKRGTLLRFLGEGLRTRHRIVSQLALMNDPDKTWEKEDLYSIYVGLWDNFDIGDRMQAIEKNLQLCTEATSMVVETVNSRRAELMEIVVIALIAIEVVRSFFAH